VLRQVSYMVKTIK